MQQSRAKFALCVGLTAHAQGFSAWIRATKSAPSRVMDGSVTRPQPTQDRKTITKKDTVSARLRAGKRDAPRLTALLPR